MDKSSIAVCGLICEGCDILIACTDYVLANKISEWFKENTDTDVSPDDISCGGCRGPRDEHWSPECEILLCCIDDKDLEFCYQCDEFVCEMLEEWAGKSERYNEGVERLKEIKSVGLDEWLKANS